MAEDLFRESDKTAIRSAIQQAEKNTSGEIRVHIERHCKEDVLDRAAGLFDLLGMQKTELRNGVLFYLAVKDHKFAILGDGGINQKTGEDFWIEVKDEMTKHFKEGEFSKGLQIGIEMAGKKLQEFFPYRKDDKNELSDDISFGA